MAAFYAWPIPIDSQQPASKLEFDLSAGNCVSFSRLTLMGHTSIERAWLLRATHRLPRCAGRRDYSLGVVRFAIDSDSEWRVHDDLFLVDDDQSSG